MNTPYNHQEKLIKHLILLDKEIDVLHNQVLKATIAAYTSIGISFGFLAALIWVV